MAPDYSLLLYLAGGFLVLDLAVAVWVFLSKRRARGLYKVRSARMKRLNRIVAAGDGQGLSKEFAADPEAVLSHLRRLLEDVSPGPGPEAAIKAFLASVDLPAHARNGLRSHNLKKRIEAYLVLGLSDSPESQGLLMEALVREERSLGRLVALDRIARHPVGPDMATLFACLEAGAARNRSKEILALAPLGPRINAHFEAAGAPSSDIGLELYLSSARSKPSEADWEKLKDLALARDDALGESAAKVLAECYPPSRFLGAFSARTERRFRLPAAQLLGLSLLPEGLGALDPWFRDSEYREYGIAAASDVLKYHPDGVGAFLDLIGGEDGARCTCLSLAIEYRLPGLLYHARPPLGRELKSMISCLLSERRAGIILESLSIPMPKETRKAYVDFLRSELAGRQEVSAFLSRHLPPDLAGELDLAPSGAEEDKPQIPMEGRDKVFLASLLALGLAIFPLAVFLLNRTALPWLSGREILYRFIFDFQWLFAFYTMAVNATYLFLLFLSMGKLHSQAQIWECDLGRIITKAAILPGISIIAPAYNEERTIVESVHSLLSLAYPSYQVIVVNDGSSDSTLEVLVSSFDLQPAASGAAFADALASMPVRTLYRSTSLPNLLVIDKVNGGKADALNAGLNRATGEFVCTIDADSVLDPQALLRAMLQVVASEHDIIAIGGNVFPVNGCVVEHGHLQEISLPGEALARIQTVEYLRSFVAGRLGWTNLDSLLIISGAFGLFRRKAVMELGGYLTGVGSYRQETVGEDMEIVVRLIRKDREEGRKGHIDYAYNANCWTEVPETWQSLRKQRDRWHRGLMEVLCFHKSMAFNPRYGAPGMLSLPYFLLFEIIGPWLESLGYAVLAAALIFNLIDPIIPLTVFSVAIFFGILISVASMLLAERQILYFRTKEFFKLLAVAVI